MTVSIPGRTLAELQARYDLHPDLRDVYVEGVDDCGIIEWFTEKGGIDGVSIYVIANVDVPPELAIKLGGEDNNRARVVAAASAVAATRARNVCFIADTDLGYLQPERRPEISGLFWTDYGSLEMYLADSIVVEKYWHQGLHGCSQPACGLDEMLHATIRAAHEMFLTRAANVSLGWGMKWVDVRKCIQIIDGNLMFDQDLHRGRYLNSNARISEKDRFEEHQSQLRAAVSGDLRRFISGHDWIELFAMVISKATPRHSSVADPAVVKRMLWLSVEFDWLSAHALFAGVRTRLLTPQGGA